ncbi:glucose dehydrogenase [FAD, quinone]-like [Coccinella septempunctata]|uniref:glucose dehydrogenase [FAD, quinone]-like n=1 Tax=Coccinella septempunctata TaxID=41139 RepID=UPI001D072A56|nr:glucose dehydrogenase [FAD, quinone]-like [Coccinella septempunctata]
MKLQWFLLFLLSTYLISSIDGDMTDFILKQIALQPEVNNILHFREYGDGEEPQKYDFVIIGSGSAGSVIANRLSEVPQWRILLLEVGREATGFSDIPFLAPALQFTDLNWGYTMEQQEGVALGMVNERMPWPRGKVLGGSTVINYMLYVRGNKEDYNNWEKMGNPGWGYKDVLKYFLKSEDAMLAVNDTEYHGKGGYQTVQDVPFRTESADGWVKASQEAGYKYVDYNGKQQLGVSYVQGTITNGRRCSVEKAFLRPAKDRPNLTILTGARATKILIDPVTREAYGVEYIRRGRTYTAMAEKEVISSAGTFHSPQLLMLSGIGPKDQLESLNIPIIQDLQVGQKLYDHLLFVGLLFSVNESITITPADVLPITSFIEWKFGRGPYTLLGGVEAVTYIKVKEEGPTSLPDIELLFLGLGLHTDAGALVRKSLGLTDESFNALWKPLIGKPGFQIFPMLLHPKSYGNIELTSKDPQEAPLFYGNYFTDPEDEDMRTLIASIREVQRIVNTSPSLQKYGAKMVPWSIAGCENEEFDSDDYWRCGLQHLAITLHHQTSTCKMGPKKDPEAVVDHELKVYGIKKLRVADSSVIPLPLAAHINAPTIMVGEKAADMIKEEWKKTNKDSL